jgi:hypothetical protein
MVRSRSSICSREIGVAGVQKLAPLVLTMSSSREIERPERLLTAL